MRAFPRGQCPTAHAPMQTGDGLLGRIKPPLGAISSDGARVIADAARRYGSGLIEVTNRGAIQVRGLVLSSADDFSKAIVGAGLASADAMAEQRRNVAVTPFADSCITALAQTLERWLEHDDGLSALPPKFGFAIDSARAPAAPLAADIRCIRQQDSWRIELDGAELATLTPTPFEAASRLARSFLDLAAGCESRPRRMRDLVAQLGAAALYGAAKLTPTPAPALPRVPLLAPVGWSGHAWRSFGLGCPFGALDATMLRAAADAADRFAGGRLHVTPYRAFLLRDVAPVDVEELTKAAREAGYIVAADDPRLAMAACAGRPACASALMPARDDAVELATLQPSWLRAGVHLSGCSKGCAHPGAAAITLVGGAGGYDLVLDGCSSDAPVARQLSLAQAVRLLDERFAKP